MSSHNQRKVVALVHYSIDGYSAGPDGDISWAIAFGMADDGDVILREVTANADTALMGRTNFEGFQQAWPAIGDDPDQSPTKRAFAEWIAKVDKVAFSRQRTELDAPRWSNYRVSADLEGEVRKLREQPGHDILILNSASIIAGLLKADLVDELRFSVLPTIVGGGLSPLPEGLPASDWTLTGATPFTESGAVALRYTRRRA